MIWESWSFCGAAKEKSPCHTARYAPPAVFGGEGFFQAAWRLKPTRHCLPLSAVSASLRENYKSISDLLLLTSIF